MGKVLEGVPEGWVLTTINNICIFNPKDKLSDDLDVGFMPMSGLYTDHFGKCEFSVKKWIEVKKGFTQFKNGDVVLAKITPCFENGKAGIITGFPNDSGAGSTEYFVLRTSPTLNDARILFAYLKTKPFLVDGALNMSGSVGHKRVPKDFLLNYPFPLMPFEEQKVLAIKLNGLLLKLESIKTRIDHVPAILKRFRQAVLISAIEGSLVNKVYGNWNLEPLENISSHIVDCPHSTPEWSVSGRYCVRTTAFRPFYLDLADQGYVSDEVYQERVQRLKPEPEDILYSREGTVGVACQIPKGVELCLGQRMVLIRAGMRVLPKYLTMVLNSEVILRIVREKTMGSTVPRINMKDIREYKIPVPSLKEQAEIVARVDKLFAWADNIEKQVAEAQQRVNHLTQSILAKAFRGELTEQWRRDNPELISGENSAAALLERIKAERQATAPKRKTKAKKQGA